MSQPKPPADASQPVEAPPPKKGSALRLSILLVVLAILIVALAYDYAVAKPAMMDANKRLQALVDERHKQGVETGQPVVTAEVQKVIGFAPTRTEKKDDKTTVEWYCWWGPMPYLSTSRRYLWVKYEGSDPQYVSTFDYETDPDDPGSQHPKDGLEAPLPRPGNKGGLQGHSNGLPGGPKTIVKPAEEKPATEKPAEEKPAGESPAAPTGGTND